MDTKPCGHSVKEKGILLKVFASCKSNQIPYRLAYSTRGIGNDKNSGACFIKSSGKEIEKDQNTTHLDATIIRCENKDIDAKCTLRPDYSWKTMSECKQVFLVRGKERDRPCWHYVLLVDDQETIDKFQENENSGNVDASNYGKVLESGWGEEPSNEVKDRNESKYFVVYT